MRRALRPRHPAYLLTTAAAAAALVLGWAAFTAYRPWSPKSGLGLATGIAAALLFVFGMLYPARRPRAFPFRNAQDWLQAHLYLCTLAGVAVLVHAGFRWPGGAMGWALLLASALVIGTGLGGVYLQKTLAPALADGLRVQALFERIPELVDALCAEADARVEGAGEALSAHYAGQLRPELSRLRPSWSYLSDVRAGREAALQGLQQLAPFVDAEDAERVADLTSIYTQKLELDAQWRVQWVLRQWLALHALPAGVLLALLAVHVFTWLWY